jgi:hypothetical protein
MNVSAERILQELDCSYGKHNVLIFGSLDVLREFYVGFCKRALQDNEVVVFLSYYEPVKKVYDYMENAGIDVAKHKRSHSLFIEDSVQQFFGTSLDFFKFLRILDEGAVGQGKKGVCVLVSADSLFHHGDTNSIVKYEEELEQVANLEHSSIICMYHAESFAGIPKSNQDHIVRQHNKVVK